MVIKIRNLDDGQIREFSELGFRIGRKSAECECVFPTSHIVSRIHAEIRPTPDGYVIRDLGSAHGTRINHASVAEPTPIAEGDQIALGLGGPVIEVISIPKTPPTQALARENTPPPTPAKKSPVPRAETSAIRETRLRKSPKYTIPASTVGPSRITLPAATWMWVLGIAASLLGLGLIARGWSEPSSLTPETPVPEKPAKVDLEPPLNLNVELPPLAAKPRTVRPKPSTPAPETQDDGSEAYRQIEELAARFRARLPSLQVFLVGEKRRRVIAAALPMGDKAVVARDLLEAQNPYWELLRKKGSYRVERFVVLGAAPVLNPSGAVDRQRVLAELASIAGPTSQGLVAVPLARKAVSLPVAEAQPGVWVALLDHAGVVHRSEQGHQLNSAGGLLVASPPLPAPGAWSQRHMAAPVLSPDGVVGIVTKVGKDSQGDAIVEKIVPAHGILKELRVR